jgi:hypothetical protein
MKALPTPNHRQASLGRMSRQAALWAFAALLGIALAAGITWATGQLTSQHIGLSSEPLSAGSRLAPRVAGAPTRARSRTSLQQGAATVTSSTPPVSSTPAEVSSTKVSSTAAGPAVTSVPTQAPRTPSASGDDGHGGHGGGHGGGRDD